MFVGLCHVYLSLQSHSQSHVYTQPDKRKIRLSAFVSTLINWCVEMFWKSWNLCRGAIQGSRLGEMYRLYGIWPKRYCCHGIHEWLPYSKKRNA